MSHPSLLFILLIPAFISGCMNGPYQVRADTQTECLTHNQTTQTPGLGYLSPSDIEAAANICPDLVCIHYGSTTGQTVEPATTQTETLACLDLQTACLTLTSEEKLNTTIQNRRVDLNTVC